MTAVDWGYFSPERFPCARFEPEGYLPPEGEGETMASQAVTAVCRIVHRYYNDGDAVGEWGECDDGVRSCANWLAANVPGAREAFGADPFSTDYTEVLRALADACLDPRLLARLSERGRKGSVYGCDGPFSPSEEGGE